MNDRELQNIHRKAINSLEQLQNQLKQSET